MAVVALWVTVVLRPHSSATPAFQPIADCQLCPPLFPTLKHHENTTRIPGSHRGRVWDEAARKPTPSSLRIHSSLTTHRPGPIPDRTPAAAPAVRSGHLCLLLMLYSSAKVPCSAPTYVRRVSGWYIGTPSFSSPGSIPSPRRA